MIFDTEKGIKVISHDITRPPFNLAAEEIFLRRRVGSSVLLWRNSPAIVIGRNQNAYSELDTDYVSQNGIDVIRRLTGGGAVYHDLGNLNFSFICPCDGMADFRAFLSPVVSYLRSLGLNADFSGRNDILVDGKKVSGCAQASSHGRVILHGTLLFSADMSALSSALKPHPLKLTSKGIPSVRSRVTNIADELHEPMSITEFRDGLLNWFLKSGDCQRAFLTESDTAEIEVLEHEKYSTHEWNFGASPAYSIESSAKIGGSIVTVCYNVDKGKIASLRFFGDFFGEGEIAQLEEKLIGIKHERSEIEKALHEAGAQKFILCATPKELSQLF